MNKIAYRNFVKYNNKLIAVKTILDRNNGDKQIGNYYTGYSIIYNNYRFKVLPYSNDISYTLSFLK
jgi:hypothetical protein